MEGVQPYIIVWFSNFDKVIACHASEAVKMKEDGKKSISLKMLNNDTYHIIELPSEKKRVFMTTDYTYLIKVVKDK